MISISDSDVDSYIRKLVSMELSSKGQELKKSAQNRISTEERKNDKVESRSDENEKSRINTSGFSN